MIDNKETDFYRIGMTRISVTDEERAIHTIKEAIPNNLFALYA